MESNNSKLKIIPLGGLHEVGKNMTVFEYENDIFVLDCGLAFPEDDMLGVDLVIPDVSYLVKNADKIRKTDKIGSYRFRLAERTRFELVLHFCTTPLAGAPLRPLEYLSKFLLNFANHFD